jgi:hypothetical protein
MGGGARNVAMKIECSTEHDSNDPMAYEGAGWSSFPNEKFNGKEYQRPHENISVALHFSLQQVPVAKIQYFDDNDV